MGKLESVYLSCLSLPISWLHAIAFAVLICIDIARTATFDGDE